MSRRQHFQFFFRYRSRSFFDLGLRDACLKVEQLKSWIGMIWCARRVRATKSTLCILALCSILSASMSDQVFQCNVLRMYIK